MPLPPPPAEGFTSNGNPTVLGRREECDVVERGVGDAGHGRDPGCRDVAFRADLVAHHLECLDARPDEHDASVAARLGEPGMLGEEPVPRMHRLGARVERCGDDERRIEVALGRRRRTDAHGIVGEPHVRRIGVGVGVDGDRMDAEPSERADDPHGDLAAIGDEHPVERARGASGLGTRHPQSGVVGRARERDHSRLSATLHARYTVSAH